MYVIMWVPPCVCHHVGATLCMPPWLCVVISSYVSPWLHVVMWMSGGRFHHLDITVVVARGKEVCTGRLDYIPLGLCDYLPCPAQLVGCGRGMGWEIESEKVWSCGGVVVLSGIIWISVIHVGVG